jgi:hypothetical protein
MNMISGLFLGHQADIRVFPIPGFSEHHTILSAEMILHHPFEKRAEIARPDGG